MSIFEDVKQSLNIREVIEYYGFTVNRAGQFACPFHNDKHPSASIKKDYFHCFVCGAGGDVIKFTAMLHGLSNYDACKKLAADFGLSIAEPQTPIERLKADRERAKRQAEKEQRENEEELIQHAGIILGEYHRYLWQGRKFYKCGHIRHTRSLQWLDYAQYLCQCYDENPREYSIKNREQVAKIETRLHQWHHEEQQL